MKYIAEWWAYSHKLGRYTGRNSAPKLTLDEAKKRLSLVDVPSIGRCVWSVDENDVRTKVHQEPDIK